MNETIKKMREYLQLNDDWYISKQLDILEKQIKLNKMKNLKFKTVTISVVGANSEIFEYHKNNEYKNTTKEDIINIFKLESLGMANILDDVKNMKSFNSCNWNAPYTFDGVAPGDIYDGIALVNIHLGGDVRGNYSEPYICEEPDVIFSQSTFLDVELTNGDIFSFDCDNGEAYFDFDTLDPYYIDFDKNITKEQLEELTEKNEQ